MTIRIPGHVAHRPDSQPSQLEKLGRLRQGLYRLFGALFLYPDGERLATLSVVAEELQEAEDSWSGFAFSDTLRRLLERLTGLDESPHMEIEEECTRLFLVNPVAPPYESFYMDAEGLARGWISVQLEREYADSGLSLARTLKEPPDHVAVELEFMAFLCGQQADAWEGKAETDRIRAQARQRAFLGQHLACWFPRFAARAKEANPTALYDVATAAAAAFVHHDVDLLLPRGGEDDSA